MKGATSPTQAGHFRHRFSIAFLALAGFALVCAILWSGLAYYRLPVEQRPFHPLHATHRPAGGLGLRLGFASAFLFFCIYLYPLRKRIPFLQKIGKTRRWLDFHVLFGLTVPLIVTLHASLKLHGLIGLAYWIMMAIVVSGVAGRYLYSQIPRTVNAAEISLRELGENADAMADQLRGQNLFEEAELQRILALPSLREVEAMPLLSALAVMALLDLRRPFRVAALRRKVLSPFERVVTLGGLLASRHADLEGVLSVVRNRAWLTAKILFLNRAVDIFHFWHVVHRPFSYSFALIVTAHIVLVVLMGYY